MPLYIPPSSATPAAVATAAVVGTGASASHDDHVHAHETAHVAHDTIWDAAGDLAVGTGADTAAKLAIAAPAANVRNVLGVDNGETTWAVKTALDGTNPAAVGTAAPGTSLVFAHRDHVHATGAGTPSTQAMGDAAATGSGPAASMTDHKHAMPALGFGLTSNSTPAVSLTTASAFTTATTSVSAATYADITGATVTLATGTWLVIGQCSGSSVNAQAIMHVAITDASNTVLSEGSQGIGASGTASVGQLGTVTVSAIVSATGAAIKLRAARGLTTITGTWVAMNGAGTNTSNNLTDGSNKGTGIFAVRLA